MPMRSLVSSMCRSNSRSRVIWVSMLPWKKVPHVRSAEIAFPFLQFIECRMDGQQQFLDFRIGLHRLAALSFRRFSRTFHSLGVHESWC